MKKELSEVERKRLLKKHHHQKIDYALAKAFINDSDVYKLVKDFFAEYLGLDYEFAHEELHKELNKRFIDETLKKEIGVFLANLSHLQFNVDTKPTQDQLRSLITRFKDIIEKLIVFEEQKKKSPFSWFTDLFSKKIETKTEPELIPEQKIEIQPEKEEKNEIVENALKELESTLVVDTKDDPNSPTTIINQIDSLISENKIPQAKQTYKKLVQIYNQLPEIEKKKYYGQISNYYSKLSKI